MELLIWIGAAVSLAGLAGILWCILAALRARRAGGDEAAQRKRMQRVVAVNMAALFVSTIGLMLVVLGIILR